MIGAFRIATLSALLLALAVPSAQAATSRPDLAPGVEVEDACMAEALLETGFQGAIRVSTPAASDHSLEICDPHAEAMSVADYRAVAGPCTADALRDQGSWEAFASRTARSPTTTSPVSPPRGPRDRARSRTW